MFVGSNIQLSLQTQQKNTSDSSTDSTTLRFDMLTDGANTSTIFRHKKHKDTRNPIYTLRTNRQLGSHQTTNFCDYR